MLAARRSIRPRQRRVTVHDGESLRQSSLAQRISTSLLDWNHRLTQHLWLGNLNRERDGPHCPHCVMWPAVGSPVAADGERTGGYDFADVHDQTRVHHERLDQSPISI
jgi:hypothetical protein